MPEQTPQQPLLDELQVWKHNRGVYPGWLIAPRDVRERIWTPTRDGIFHFLRLRSSLSVEQELELLFELNWRLEKTLVPLGCFLAEFAQAYSHIVTAINPFPDDIHDLPTAALVLTEANARAHDWSAVRRQWLAIAFGLLRHHREERQAEAFAVLHARLGAIRDLGADAQARWSYEQCLFAFESLDDEAVIRGLAEWPQKTLDPFWAIRKAAVLAEVGRTDQALEVAQRGLGAIRTGLADGPEHIPALSREGWAMWLMMALRTNQSWRGRPRDDASIREELRRRFQQLKRHGCSPDELTDYFESRLEQPTPQPKEEAVTSPGFDPGTYSETLHLGSNFGAKLLPAYQYYRLMEEAAQPPAFGHVSISKDKATRVAEWLSEHYPVRAQSLVLRLHSDKLLDQYFSRHRVAALRQEVVTRFKVIARQGVARALPSISRSAPPESDEALRASQRLGCSVDLLSRMCIREPEDGIDELWELAETLYKDPGVRASVGLGDHLQDLFTSLSKATPRPRLIQRLPQLLSLPVGGEPDFAVLNLEFWPDPATLAARCIHAQVWQRPPRGWGDLKKRLLALARGSAAAKKIAFFRLLHMGSLGGLSAADRTRLAHIFWTAAGEPPSLPLEVWGLSAPSMALALPDIPGIDAVERVRQHILASQPGEVHRGVVWPERFFDLVLFATGPFGGPEEGSSHRRYVPWTAADAALLLEIISRWWESRGRAMAADMHSGGWRRAYDGPPLRRVLLRLWDVLRLVIIPRLTRRRAAITAVSNLIGDVRTVGLPVGAVLPALLILRPDSLQEVISGLRREFANPEEGFFLSALRGIVYWVERSVARGGRSRPLQAIPNDLLREISIAVAVRRAESLGLSLDCSYNILRRQQRSNDRLFVRNILTGLDYLFTETAYREAAAAGDRYPYAEVPRLRWLAARLAICLSSRGFQRDPIIRRWREAAADDPLPEIRHLLLEPETPIDS